MTRTQITSPILFALFLCSHLSTAAEPNRATALTAKVVLKVIHIDQVRKKILDATGKAGGFRVLVTDTHLRLKVPHEKLSELLESLGDHGLVMNKTIDRKDLTQEIAQLKGALRSKQEIFARLEKLVDRSDLVSTLNIEKTMSDLVGEIEQTKGRLMLLKEQALWAVIDLSFQFRARQEIVYVNSPFKWLNSVDLTSFVEEF